MIKAILFDMDGTLLPMDQDVFTNAYFGALCKALAPHGYEPKQLIGGVWKGISAMLACDGSETGESAFWRAFCGVFGQNATSDIPLFDEFYKNGFDALKAACGFNEKAKGTIAALKAKGFRLALATNPVFPMIAQQKRLAWAGLDQSDFELITAYENSNYCKPNLGYYKQITDALGYPACECLMVGNDVSDDMPARELGMAVYLVTDCLINKDNKDISEYPHGDLDGLMDFVNKL